MEIMRNSLVVGMTTTGAARLQSLLKALKPKIGKLEKAILEQILCESFFFKVLSVTKLKPK